jgi:hypothetical protein
MISFSTARTFWPSRYSSTSFPRAEEVHQDLGQQAQGFRPLVFLFLCASSGRNWFRRPDNLEGDPPTFRIDGSLYPQSR